MAASEVYKSKFPPTKQLDACYTDIVPDKSHHHASLQHLESILSENRNNFSTRVPSSSCKYLPSSYPEHAHLSERINELREELTNQIAALQRSIHLQEDHLSGTLPAVQSLIRISRESPSIGACVLGRHTHATPTVVGIRSLGRMSCAATKGTCQEKTLPFSRFCLKHITHDSDQVLYRSCLAIDKSSLTQCREPVVDILSEESHCLRHSTPVGGDSLPGRPPPRKKMALQPQSSRQHGSAGRGGGVGGSSGLKLAKKSALASRGMSASSKETMPSKSHPHGEAPSDKDKPTSKSATKSRSLDDLLTLSPALPAPVPMLDLVPLKADIGEIMMAGEGSSSGGSTNTSDNEGEAPANLETTHTLT